MALKLGSVIFDISNDFDGADLYHYRRLLTHILKKDFSFRDTDEEGGG